MPVSPALQAQLDQWGANVRDIYDAAGVNVHDPDQARAIRATILMVHHYQWYLPYILGGITEAVGT